MYPPEFEYAKANSVSEAIEMLGKQKNASFLAGGHSLIPAMKLRVSDPGYLVDIGRISELKGIKDKGGSVNIGALTTHAEVADSSDVPSGLSEAAGLIGDPQVRNRGTVGGNVAHADPGSDLPPVLVALGATINVQDAKGSRAIPASDFFTGLFETSLKSGEIITTVDVSKEGKSQGSAYEKLANPASGYSMVGAAASLSVKDGKCDAASVAIGGLTSSATSLPSVGAALVGKTLDESTIAAAAKATAGDLGDDILGDIHASEDYRKSMAEVIVMRAITKAAGRV